MIVEKLDNGLSVVIEKRTQTQLAVVNVLYKVGSRNEKLGKTGMAHLLEHLMFEGSKKFPQFDQTIHLLGGENNAYTTNDYTNYYDVLPAENLEKAIEIEADRMMHLQISAKKFKNQQQVVIEEFKESHLNMPYGMHWHELCGMMYPGHYYEWPVIGANIHEIDSFLLPEVIEFYKTYYSPQNAVVSVVGNIDEQKTLSLLKAHFGAIPSTGHIPSLQASALLPTRAQKILREEVPQNALFMAFAAPMRYDKSFYTMDLICDILANGESSRFYDKLYKKQKLFSEIDAYVTANIGPGMLIIEGKLHDGVSLDQASNAILQEINALCQEGLAPRELEKVKNKAESFCVFSNYQLTNRAANLCLFNAYDSIEHLTLEHESYQQITKEDIRIMLQDYFLHGKMVELRYEKI